MGKIKSNPGLRPAAPKLIAGWGLLCLLLIFRAAAFSSSAPDPLHLPAGFDFTFAISGEGYTLDEFYASYFDTIVYSDREDPYGLALANLTLGLVKRDPFYIVTAKALFAANNKLSDDPGEKRLSELAVKYTGSLLSGVYDKDGTRYTVEPVEINKSAPPSKELKR